MVHGFGFVFRPMAQIEIDVEFPMIAFCASFELVVPVEMIRRLEGTSRCHGGGWQGPPSHTFAFFVGYSVR